MLVARTQAAPPGPARGRALAASAQDANVTLVTELRRLRDYASNVGMLASVSRFDQALQDV